MKPLTEKILKSGIIDKHTAALMEHYGMLPEGATEKVNEDALKGATQAQLVKLADDLMDEVERANALRETVLDLERLRWPVEVKAIRGHRPGDPLTDKSIFIAGGIVGVIDRQGRYYFRIQDVNEEWFVPGYEMERNVTVDGRKIEFRKETILEAQKLFIDDNPVCIQVTASES